LLRTQEGLRRNPSSAAERLGRNGAQARSGLRWPAFDPGLSTSRSPEGAMRLANSRAFSGKVDAGLPQKMRPTKEARARFRFNLIETRSSRAILIASLIVAG